MGLQVWRSENVENVLWALQIISQAGLVQDSHQLPCFRQGFLDTLVQVTHSFTNNQPRHGIWAHNHIEDALLAVRVMNQTAISGLNNKADAHAFKRDYDQGGEVALWAIAMAFGVNLLPSNEIPESPPSSDLLFWEDLQHFLSAIKSTAHSTFLSKQEVELVSYFNGYELALTCLARSFSLMPLLPVKTRRRPMFYSRREIQTKIGMIYQTVPGPGQETSLAADQEGFVKALQGFALAFGVHL